MQQNKNISISRYGALVWLPVILGLAVWLVIRINSGPVINANIMASLPTSLEENGLDAAVEDFEDQIQRNLVILVSASTEITARDAATLVFDRLTDSYLFESLKLRQDEAVLRHVGAFYFPFRFNLLSNQSRRDLLAGDLAAFERRLMRRYFNPVDGLTSELIEFDPLLLLPDFLGEFVATETFPTQLNDGYLKIQKEDRVYILLSGKLKGSPFSLPLQERLVPLLQELRADMGTRFPGSRIAIAGVFPHAAAGTESARREISTVGLGSLLGIVVLFIVVFRSLRPFLLSFLSIGIGCLGGFAICLAVFGQVHILTLVFGASLVGISVDYSLHYFCESFRPVRAWSPNRALFHIFPGITLGLITSVIGFAGLLAASFPGMREMAVFSGAGLIFAYLSVIAFYPLSVKRLASSGRVLIEWSETYQRFLARQPLGRILLVLVLLLCFSVVGCLMLMPLDDFRMLQALNSRAVAEEDRVKAVTGQDISSRFFVVSGQDENQLLERLEDLNDALQVHESDGRLGGSISLSNFVPSPSRQSENRALLKSLISGEGQILERLAERIALPESAGQTYVEGFEASDGGQQLHLENWLSDPVSDSVRHLWLGDVGQGESAVVVLNRVRDIGVFGSIAEQRDGVTFVDGVQEASELFRSYRNQALWLTAGSYILVTLLLIMRYGLAGGLVVIAVPLGAALVCFGALGFLAEPISLFNIMALILVLGIGVDYGIFFREAGGLCAATFLAVTMSSVTTVLAFGLLTVSSTTAVHSFGITLLIGISTAYFLSPLAGMVASSESTDELAGELL